MIPYFGARIPNPLRYYTIIFCYMSTLFLKYLQTFTNTFVDGTRIESIRAYLGGLAGGICAGIFAEKLSVKRAGNLIVACALALFPAGLTLMVCSSGMINYMVLTVCCFVIMVLSTMFSVQMVSFVQMETPQNLIGKVIAVILTVSMCAQPLGNALYGVLFEVCNGFEFAVILFAGGVSLLISCNTKHLFEGVVSMQDK